MIKARLHPHNLVWSFATAFITHPHHMPKSPPKRCSSCGNITDNFIYIRRECYRVRKYICGADLCMVDLTKSKPQKSRLKCIIVKRIKKRLQI